MGSFDDDQTVVASAEPALNKYGQNGYQGASSDLPGKSTAIAGFMKQVKVAEAKNDQMRTVSAQQYPTKPGMRSRSGDSAKVVDYIHRKD